MTTYGSDFAGVEDIDAFWTFETNEGKCLMQALARRLICPPGALFYARTYGYDIRALLNDIVDPDTAARDIDAEIRKDERVASSSTTITVIGNGVVNIDVTVFPADPKLVTFTFTLRVTAVTVELLENQ